jgi:hypothetical protein
MGKTKLLVFAVLALLLAGCVGAGNLVWLDENGNGIQDSGEPGVEGVTVRMIGADDQIAGASVTDTSGMYMVYDVLPFTGPYVLEFSLPDGYSFTLQDEGTEELDSDADPATGRTREFTILVDNEDSFDAGLILQQSAVSEVQQEEEEEPTATPTPTVAPEGGEGGQGESTSENVCYGPLDSEFPEGVSPLSGLEVTDPALLALRPVFLSISIFPPSVRPPTGLAVSPIVYQLYIGDGDTRLMAGFYGEFPQPIFEAGNGEASNAPTDFDYLIGDRVWFDANGNHLQDDGEPGVANVPVRLVDINLNTIETTTTDAQGYYYFALNDVDPNTEMQLRFGAPPSIADYYWVNKDIGDDAIDSDVTGLGRTDFFDPTDADTAEQLYYDAGLRQAHRIEGLRSGRVAYQDLQVNYCGCLITAGADPTVAQQINTCGSAFGDDSSNIGGAGLDVTRLQAIASNNTTGVCSEPNLSGNLFCTQPPSEEFDSAAGDELYVEYNVNNVSHFSYNPDLNAYSWALSVPRSDRGSEPFDLLTEAYEVMTDRLTGETLSFENVVVMVVPHVAQNEAITIINLQMASARGVAYIFRNGQMFEAEWSTQFPDYVTDRDQPIPVHFEVNGEPFPMAPGQTFINLLNQTSGLMSTLSDGVWRADFDAPAYTPN